MKNAEVERRIRQIAWPSPSRDLRARVLAAATVTPQPIMWSDRIWFSRAWRFAGAAAAAAAIAVASWNSTAADARLVTPEARANAQVVADVGRALGVPAGLSASLAQRTLAARGTPSSDWRARASLDEFETGDRR